MNVGHEEEELKPYIEPEADFSDSSRIGVSDFVFVCFLHRHHALCLVHD